ncbi:hypothetical protein NXW89_19355 [Bacteroides thetaiotaomicron]|nr:hypothetical protein [Bacteroides thetaiotaomicron]
MNTYPDRSPWWTCTGLQQVRFPGLASTLYGAAFIDDTGKIVSRVSVSNANGFINGMYLFCAVPAGATFLAFTFLNSAAFDFVLLTTSESARKRSSRTG